MICEIGAMNHRFKDAVGGSAVEVQGKKQVCPHPMEPLAVWVKFRYPVQAGYTAVTDICLDCYKMIFEEDPMPSAYQGYEKGRLMTDALADEAYVASSKNYEVDWTALAVPVPAAVPPVPERLPNLVKPRLERQNAMFFNWPKKR